MCTPWGQKALAWGAARRPFLSAWECGSLAETLGPGTLGSDIFKASSSFCQIINRASKFPLKSYEYDLEARCILKYKNIKVITQYVLFLRARLEKFHLHTAFHTEHPVLGARRALILKQDKGMKLKGHTCQCESIFSFLPIKYVSEICSFTLSVQMKKVIFSLKKNENKKHLFRSRMF